MIFPSTDSEAWRACYQRLAPKLLLFARQWVPLPADAEDVVQTAFVRFWQKQPSAAPEHYPLVFTAVRTAALDFLRARERRNRRETAYQIETPEACFECGLEQREEAAGVQEALTRLPHAQREVLVLRIWGELTFAEIGRTLDESINTVASRYRTGLQTLRQSFTRQTTRCP